MQGIIAGPVMIILLCLYNIIYEIIVISVFFAVLSFMESVKILIPFFITVITSAVASHLAMAI